MPLEAQVKTEGFEDLFKALNELGEEIGKGKTDRIYRNAMKAAFQPVLDTARTSAPVRTGQLEEHLYLKVQRPQSRDKNSKYYEGEVWMARVTLNPKREESIQNVTLNKRGKFQNSYVNPPVGLALEFGTAKMAAHPFLRPALEANASTVVERLGQQLWYELTWGKYAKG